MNLIGKFIAQFGEIDPAEVYREPLGVVLAGFLCADGFVDDFVQFLEHVGHIGRVPLFLQFFVDRLDVVMSFGEDKRAWLHQQGLEPDEYLPGHDLEPSLGLIRGSKARPRHPARPGCGQIPSPRSTASDWKPSPLRWFSAASIA